jgi:hypothetical protein
MVRQMMTHFPWDDGAISGTWLAVGQKTIKAQCGARVAMSAITLDGHIACPACRAKLETRALECEAVARDYPQYDTLGASANLAKFVREVLAR